MFTPRSLDDPQPVRRPVERAAVVLRRFQRGLHSVQPEKSLHHRDRARWVLFLRRVAEIIKDCEYAAGDIAVEAFGVVRRDQAVAPPPEDKGRQLQFWDAVRETAGLALPESINQRTTVAFALVDRDGAIHHLEGHATGHPTRVAEYLRHERLIRKAKTSADEALAYAARVIWHRQRRAADKRRKLEALSHPRYFSYFLDAAK
jgi:hypothetical protein